MMNQKIIFFVLIFTISLEGAENRIIMKEAISQKICEEDICRIPSMNDLKNGYDYCGVFLKRICLSISTCNCDKPEFDCTDSFDIHKTKPDPTRPYKAACETQRGFRAHDRVQNAFKKNKTVIMKNTSNEKFVVPNTYPFLYNLITEGAIFYVHNREESMETLRKIHGSSLPVLGAINIKKAKIKND